MGWTELRGKRGFEWNLVSRPESEAVFPSVSTHGCLECRCHCDAYLFPHRDHVLTNWYNDNQIIHPIFPAEHSMQIRSLRCSVSPEILGKINWTWHHLHNGRCIMTAFPSVSPDFEFNHLTELSTVFPDFQKITYRLDDIIWGLESGYHPCARRSATWCPQFARFPWVFLDRNQLNMFILAES